MLTSICLETKILIITNNFVIAGLRCRAFSRGLPVVKPGWILDSVAAEKLLDCEFMFHVVIFDLVIKCN